MEQFTISHEGVTYVDMTREEMIDKGVPEDHVDKAIQADKSRRIARGKINLNAGDVPALLGTTSDAAAISILGIAALTVALKSSSDYGKFKKTFLSAMEDLAGDHDMVAISASFLGKIKDKEVLIPALIKGLPDVVKDIEDRSTAVSKALIASSKQG